MLKEWHPPSEVMMALEKDGLEQDGLEQKEDKTTMELDLCFWDSRTQLDTST